jgi:hypothetical protein
MIKIMPARNLQKDCFTIAHVLRKKKHGAAGEG